VVVLIAGSLQLTAWKARQLACCLEAPGRGRTLSAGAGTAWRHGLRLGLHCSRCCAGLMAIPLVIGVMDLRAMAVVAAAFPTSESVNTALRAVMVQRRSRRPRTVRRRRRVAIESKKSK
jgi:predicted metal-binding membrane protein